MVYVYEFWFLICDKAISIIITLNMRSSSALSNTRSLQEAGGMNATSLVPIKVPINLRGTDWWLKWLQEMSIHNAHWHHDTLDSANTVMPFSSSIFPVHTHLMHPALEHKQTQLLSNWHISNEVTVHPKLADCMAGMAASESAVFLEITQNINARRVPSFLRPGTSDFKVIQQWDSA